MLNIEEIYIKTKNNFEARAPDIFCLLDRYKLIVKYFFSGATATAVDLGLLYILTSYISLHYLLSATLSFIIAFFVGFYLQKFWTFRDNRRQGMRKQMSLYFLLGLLNLGINNIGMHTLVDRLHIMYMIAQIIMVPLLAIVSFTAYRFIIFRKPAHEPARR